MEKELRDKEIRIQELINKNAEEQAVQEKLMIDFRDKMNQTIDIINKSKLEREITTQNELRSLQGIIDYQEVICK